MNNFPFDLPDSLKSHLELFQKNQDKAIYMLERHLTRRGNDAVGYFLLGWFYLMQEKKEQALQCAVKARSYAPGSPFFMHLPYYFQHPALFDAWLPQSYNNPAAAPSLAYRRENPSSSFFVDIDSLISRLSRRQRTASGADSKYEKTARIPGPSPQSARATATDDAPHFPRRKHMGTRTLALIYEQQKEYQKAIGVYKQLRDNSQDPAEQARFDADIARLEDDIAEEEESPDTE